MINPQEDRVDYGSVLRPPVGFHLAEAVCTTYSLDFETLVAATIPLGLGADLSDEEMHNPIALLQALRKVAGRLVVFCDVGQIKVPAQQSRLYPLLDEVIVPVAAKDRKGRPCSFHPKAWLLRFENKAGEHSWRFVVMSRNLSKDNSWDIAVSLEGEEKRGNINTSDPIWNFMKFLKDKIPKNGAGQTRTKIVDRLMEHLREVTFHVEHPFTDFQVMPQGIGDDSCPIAFADRFSDLLVMSPFVTARTLSDFNRPERGLSNGQRILITRRAALGGLKPDDVSNFRTFVFRDDVVDGEGNGSDLHAKLYLERRYSESTLYIGSMNATESGQHRNVEMMLRLVAPNRYVNAERLLSDLCGGDPTGPRSPLVEVTRPEEFVVDPESRDQKEAERLVAALCRLKMHASCLPQDGLWKVVLVVEGAIPEASAMVWPLGRIGQRVALGATREFDGIALADLTRFFVLEVKVGDVTLRRVVSVPMSGFPEERTTSVLNELVRDRPALLRYLAMMFSTNPTLTLHELTELERRGFSDSRWAERVLPGLYEEMLQCAAEEPERIRDAGYVLGRLKGEGELLEGYRELYQAFAKALKITEEEPRHG